MTEEVFDDETPPRVVVPKIRLSEKLEKAVFGHRLQKREVEALKKRCHSYQTGTARRWEGPVMRAYSQYFGALTSLKVKAVLRELESYGYLDIWPRGPQKIIDFGAGTLGATLGAYDFFKERAHTPISLQGFDQDLDPIRWAQLSFSEFLPKHIQTSKGSPYGSDLDSSLVLSVDVLNEMGLLDKKDAIDTHAHWYREILSWCKNATESTILVFIEPASKQINRNFLALRNELIKEIPLLLPCTHSFSCPALLTDDWCHEERPYLAPSSYWNLVHEMGFQRNLLQFSMLCLGKQKTKFTSSQARMVSRRIKSKGRCEKWLCSQGKRWKVSLLNRNENEQNKPFFDLERGGIIDLDSTGLKLPE